MRYTKKYSPELMSHAKRFIERKGKHLADMLIEKKKVNAYWDDEDIELLDDEIKSLKNQIKNAKLITFGF
jgi:hypothetical protein